MKFNTILSLSFTFALAYAQVSYENDIVSDLESYQVPDVTSDFPQNVADAVDINEYSDDYGYDAGIDALDINDETSDLENVQSNLVNAPVAQVATTPETTTPEITTPEITTPEITTPENQETTPEQAQPNELVFTGASGEAAPISVQEAEEAKEEPISALDDTSKADTSIDPATIASGLVGAAAVSSAGIVFMVKRAKRRSLESVRSQISMA